MADTGKRGKTPTVMAQNECANNINNKHYGERPCLVCNSERCGYFERSVLPMITQGYVGYDNVAAVYQKMCGGVISALRQDGTTKLCECGTPLLPRQRKCDVCKEKARKAAYWAKKGKA